VKQLRLLWLIALLPLACSRHTNDKPLAVWLSVGSAPGQTTYPRAICYNPADHTFLLIDRLAYLTRLSATGEFLNRWRMPDHAAGKPVGISVAPPNHRFAGLIFVPDTHYHRVLVYRPDGTEVARFGTRGTGPGEFIFPTDVAFDPAGNIYISEYGDNDRIQVFELPPSLNTPWQHVRTIGAFGQADGQFSRPQSITILHEELFVADAANHRISVFSLDGRFLRNLGSLGSAPGQFRFPYGLETQPASNLPTANLPTTNLLVTEFGNNRVQLLTPDNGTPIATWGTGGRQPGQLAFPFAAAPRTDGAVAVADSGNHRVQLFKFRATVLP
jgi:DNA-binding beta-propeller fold protein YncE